MNDLPMTDAECRMATARLAPRLNDYARLLVTRGVALVPGQELVLNAPVEAYSFARRVVKAAYEAGARHVTVVWGDDQVSRLGYENVPLDYFESVPSWKKEQLDSLAEQGACYLWLEGSDPDALKGVNPAKPAAYSRAVNTTCLTWRRGLDFGKNAWSIAGVPVTAWAQRVFPDLSEPEAEYRLWRAVLSVSRADTGDPEGEWEKHNATFEKNKRNLNERDFDSLRYHAGNGTDLTIGLPRGHVWEGGAAETVSGVSFFPNIPTEEVFTSPDRMRADGVVHSAMPLVHQGAIVRDFWLKFEGGRVVDFDAKQGKGVLEHILATDENARRLGECALISKNSPIRESGLLFYSTLFDENASCHLALGTGFPDCFEGGCDMSVDELLERGVNHSATHVDFMIGTDDLSIVGTTHEGEEVPVFVNGQWAWE